ncbi:MAG TPA: FxsA family protein, partial [Actinomycetota bacterium]|nr:FxsA family protein [Actinomycetota bacterium]
LAALFVISALGAWLLKRQGMATWRRLQHTLREGRVPASEAVDGGLILLGGALLMTPGFVTDAAGVVLLLPPARAALKGAARRLLTLWAAKRLGLGGRVRTARVTRVVGSRRRLDPPSSR